MKNEPLKLDYLSPVMKFASMAVREILCQSTEKYDVDDPLKDEDFD